jgi:hypothetical protein
MIWPVTIPQDLLVDGYGEATPDVAIKSNMDVGPAKVRRRTTAAVRPITGKMVMTLTELGLFKSFYNTDLLGGSLRFDWTDPYDGSTAVEMRFTAPPSWSAIDPDHFEVSMALEILP